MKKKKTTYLEAKMRRVNCPVHGREYSIESVRPRTVETYESGGGRSSSTGWTPRFDAGWRQTFGKEELN